MIDDRLGIRTYAEMANPLDHLKRVFLQHKDHTFSYINLLAAVNYIKNGKVKVERNGDLLWALNAEAAYFYATGFVSITFGRSGAVGMGGLVEGNTLYVFGDPGSSNKARATLVHEAVHINSDIAAKKRYVWSNEEMAFFVEGFIFARLDPKQAKKEAKKNNHYLIGCLASDFLDTNSEPAVVISSTQFNKPISFDYTKEGGIKGKANPYKGLETMVAKHYKDKKGMYAKFDGI